MTRPPQKLAELIKRVKQAALPHGKHAALARYLGEPPQRVNDWLSGGRNPGGEVTLLMLEWVTAEEAKQQKSPGRALTHPERQTRITDHSNEKDNPSPPTR